MERLPLDTARAFADVTHCEPTSTGVIDSGLMLLPERSRVALRPFMPGDNPFPTTELGTSRVGAVINRVLGLDDVSLQAELGRVRAALKDRHNHVDAILERRFHDLCGPESRWHDATLDQRLLIGAFFTEEYAFEAAALFNPSIVPHPNQADLPGGAARFVMSLRAIGEGHVSSITFRTGVIDAAGEVELEAPSQFAIAPSIQLLPGTAPDDPGVRLVCHDHDDLSAVVIFPVTYRQRHGLEDLRLTHFHEDDGTQAYLGTYTAVGGETVRQELLRTTDFETFELTPLQGRYAATKGMALFPRRIDGAYVMLGRQDHENIWVLRSNRLYEWEEGHAVLRPRWPWEFVQLGNCSPPIEIEEGWLVLTHGVGAIRNYCIGACLLDRDDPTKVLARTRDPIIVPTCVGRDGYVPNVTYSCGALVQGRSMIVPYGVADSFTTLATVDLDWLVGAME